jgi:conjugal transfer/entry exclusion protein
MFKHHSKLKFRVLSGVLLLFVAMPLRARAQFGGGTVTVFDPSMFARQLSQLQQETAAVTNLAQQLQYMIKNTTGGGAGVWQSNQNLLANLGGIIAEPTGALLYLPGTRPAVPAALPRLQCDQHSRSAESAGQRRYDA